MTTDTPEAKLNALIEREREILKKMNVAARAMASPQVIGQLDFLLQECRMQQAELRILKNQNKDSSFDDFLSIG